MSTKKGMTAICLVAVVVAVALALVFANGEKLGLRQTETVMGYETRLFSTDTVHTIDLTVEDWEDFLETCEDEEYVDCAAVIDGESFSGLALRAKGNTSLSSVSAMDSDRYSFKIEFDHYDDNLNYYGLDKLCLNNIIQDNTYMKDYLTYRMMNEFGVDAPLCSFVYITVNGEDWGLYLAVEGVEDSFLQRNYGVDSGDLYKPDSMSFGGGRGNGKDFDMDAFLENMDAEEIADMAEMLLETLPDGEDKEAVQQVIDRLNECSETGETPDISAILEEVGLDTDSLMELGKAGMGGGNPGQPPAFPGSEQQETAGDGQETTADTEQPTAPEDGQQTADSSEMQGAADAGQQPNMDNSQQPDFGNGQPPTSGEMPEGMEPPTAGDTQSADGEQTETTGEAPENADGEGGFPGGGGMPDMGGGMGSDDVKLIYTDDDPESYSNIFSSAKTNVTEEDQTRLIASLKALGEGDAENSVNIEEVLRYFVVHNFVVNGDSYTGGMIHNYYLYEEDGLFSMIPWDYNLAFGGFQGGDASSSVNDPIDTPLNVSGDGTRPMADWIFQNETYTEQYHQYFAEFLSTVDMDGIIEQAYNLIAPYVQKDPTAFCTYEEFETGVAALRDFISLRTQSVQGQLDGIIPSTDEGQEADSSTLIDAGDLTLSDMGSMGQAMGGGPGGGGDMPDMPEGGQFPEMPGNQQAAEETADQSSADSTEGQQTAPAEGQTAEPDTDSGQPPEMPGNGQNQEPPAGNPGEAPAGTDG